MGIRGGWDQGVLEGRVNFLCFSAASQTIPMLLALSAAVCSFVAPAGTTSRGSVAAATAAAPVAPHVRMMNLFGRTGAPQPRHRLPPLWHRCAL